MADLFSALALRQSKNPYFEALMREGLNTSPIQSPWQGASRLAHALLAGLESKDSDARDRESAALRLNMPGLEVSGGMPQQQQPPMPSAPDPGAITSAPRPPMAPPLVTRPSAPPTPNGRVASAFANIPPVTGPRPGGAVQPTDRVWGDAEAEAAGLYEPAPRATMAQAQIPAQPQPAQPPQTAGAPPQRSPVQIPPQMVGQIRAMLGSRDPAIQQQGYQLYLQYAKPREEVRPLTSPQERAKYGIQPGDTNPYQIDATGKVTAVNPQPFAVNVNQQQESEFKRKAGSLSAERFNKIVEGGQEAAGIVADLSSLREIGSRITTGKSAEMQAAIGPWAEFFGVKVDGLSDLQAYEAIISKMAPRMRPPGSGATSDFEMRQFLRGLPQLGNTPEGNTIIANTFEALQRHRIAASEIASRALQGEITQSQAEKQLRELPDPMELWRKSRGQSPAAASGKVRKYNPATGKIE